MARTAKYYIKLCWILNKNLDIKSFRYNLIKAFLDKNFGEGERKCKSIHILEIP